jgi:DNA-binding NtrC family response regulator
MLAEKQKHVLIIDDDYYVRLAIQELLEDNNYKVTTSNNVSNALELISNSDDNDFDILIVDINMPYLNGLEFISFLRSKGNEIPIIIVSAYEEEKYLRLAKKLDVINFIRKPFKIDELLGTVLNATKC